MKKLNKKGFTLTELIVVIVIIGILALVLIPTLTGYINRAKESAAEQEATSYITAYNTWQMETSGQIQDIESFKDYCVRMELLEESEVDATILDVAVFKDNMTFTIKASNGYFVTYLNGKLTVSKDSPVLLQRKDFFNDVVDKNLVEINKLFSNNEATLAAKSMNSDGSYDIEILINNLDSNPLAAVEPVTKAIEYIKNAGGQSIYVAPVIDGKEMDYEDYKEKASQLMKAGNVVPEMYFPIYLEQSTTLIAQGVAFAIVYDESFTTFNEWQNEMLKLIDKQNGKLGDLIEKNSIKIVANIVEDNGDTYSVVYYFNFVDGTK